MNITIINDCRDANAVGRQIARAMSVFQGSVQLIGVESDIEAAGNLVDVLDAYGESEAVVLVNVAPRNGKAKKWENGTPFGYFWYRNILVVSSVDGMTLSLVKKLGLIDSIQVMDIPTVVPVLIEKGAINSVVGQQIIETQFRSLEFVPRAAAYLVENRLLVSESMPISEIPDCRHCVWWVDNFGNCKTTLLRSDIQSCDIVETLVGDLVWYDRLKSVPDGSIALIEGSSGIEGMRFLEVVVQGGSAALQLGIRSGNDIL